MSQTKMMVPVWGGMEEAILAPWSELRAMGFRKRDRMFGTDADGRQMLFFAAEKHCCSLTDEQLAKCKCKWYVTYETLDEISD